MVARKHTYIIPRVMKDPIIFQPKAELKRELPPTSFKFSPTVKFTTWKDAGKPKSASKLLCSQKKKPALVPVVLVFRLLLLFFLLYVEATAYSERPQIHSVLPPTSYRSAKPKKTKRKTDTQRHKSRSTKLRLLRTAVTRTHAFPSKKTAQGHAWDWQLLGNQKKARSPTQKSQREQARERKSARRRRKEASNNKQTKACREKQQRSKAKDAKEKHTRLIQITQISNPT